MAVTKSSFAHGLGISVTIPHMKIFKPTPTMTALEVAYFKGREARYFGRPDSENPYTEKHVPNDGQLAAEWIRGYEDTRK